MRLTRSILFFGIAALAPTSQVWAQTNEEAFEQFQWQVSMPGARANAMGGAFTASADDASATVRNPAGLASLGRPQFSIDFRSVDVRVGRLAAIDSLVTGALTTFSQTTNALSFVHAAIPLRHNIVTIGLGRREFLDYQESTYRRASCRD